MKKSEDGTGLIGDVVRVAHDNVASMGRALRRVLPLPGQRPRAHTAVPRVIGAPAGIDHLPEIEVAPSDATIAIRVVDYSADRRESSEVTVSGLTAWLAEPVPEWVAVRWINVDGHHPWIVDQFRLALGIHTLAAEDVLHVPQRPGVEPYDEHVFVKLRLLMLVGGELTSEQVSMFVWDKCLLTFQERAGDVWEPLRKRLARPGSPLRDSGATFLMYALLDAAVDHCFPLLEHYSDGLEALEEAILEDPRTELLHQIHRFRHELVAVRRVLWPTREMVDALMRDDTGLISERTQTYLRDVHTHAVQLLDILESEREVCSGLTDLYMSGISNRMNEIMKVLTIMATLFIPITFVAGVYGMNFEHIPELRWAWSYPVFWCVCLAVVSGLLWFFRRRGWI